MKIKPSSLKANLSMLIVGLLFVSSKGYGQQIAPPARTSLYLTVMPGDTTMPKNQPISHFHTLTGVQVTPITQQQATMYVALSDSTASFDSIYVKVTTLNDSSIFEKMFPNHEGILGDGIYVSKPNPLSILLGLSKMTGVNSYKTEVYFKSADGGTSQVVTYTKP